MKHYDIVMVIMDDILIQTPLNYEMIETMLEQYDIISPSLLNNAVFPHMLQEHVASTQRGDRPNTSVRTIVLHNDKQSIRLICGQIYTRLQSLHVVNGFHNTFCHEFTCRYTTGLLYAALFFESKHLKLYTKFKRTLFSSATSNNVTSSISHSTLYISLQYFTKSFWSPIILPDTVHTIHLKSFVLKPYFRCSSIDKLGQLSDGQTKSSNDRS